MRYEAIPTYINPFSGAEDFFPSSIYSLMRGMRYHGVGGGGIRYHAGGIIGYVHCPKFNHKLSFNSASKYITIHFSATLNPKTASNA